MELNSLELLKLRDVPKGLFTAYAQLMNKIESAICVLLGMSRQLNIFVYVLHSPLIKEAS